MNRLDMCAEVREGSGGWGLGEVDVGMRTSPVPLKNATDIVQLWSHQNKVQPSRQTHNKGSTD